MTLNESRVTTRFTNHHGEKPSERMKGGKATTSRLFATTHVTTKGTDTILEVDDTTKQRDAQNAMWELPARDQHTLCLYNQHPCKG